MAKFISVTLINRNKDYVPAVVNADYIKIVIDYVEPESGTWLWYYDGQSVQIKETSKEIACQINN